jgi:acyl-CoA thioester hydrolase
MSEMCQESGPLSIYRCTVTKEWVDRTGHMNFGFYGVAFDLAYYDIAEELGLDIEYDRTTPYAVFVRKSQFTHLSELFEGDHLHFTFQLLDFTRVQMHVFMQVFEERRGVLAATCEQLIVHLHRSKKRPAPMPERTMDWLRRYWETHSRLPRPDHAGVVLSLRKGGA